MKKNIMYTLVINHRNQWQKFYSNASLHSVKAERERLMNVEYPPVCYILKTDMNETTEDATVTEFRQKMDAYMEVVV